MRAFYETTPLTGVQLRAAFARAEKQDALVLAVFRLVAPGSLLAPSQVHAVGVANGARWLLTSVRRSISTLTRAGVLEKTGQQRMGPHGSPENFWRLADKAASP